MPASGASQRQLPAAASRHPAVRRESARLADHVRRKLRGKEQAAAPAETPRRRTDVRLGLPALLVWGAAVAGVWLTPAMLAVLCMVLLVLAVVLLARAARGKTLRPAAGAS